MSTLFERMSAIARGGPAVAREAARLRQVDIADVWQGVLRAGLIGHDGLMLLRTGQELRFSWPPPPIGINDPIGTAPPKPHQPFPEYHFRLSVNEAREEWIQGRIDGNGAWTDIERISP